MWSKWHHFRSSADTPQTDRVNRTVPFSPPIFKIGAVGCFCGGLLFQSMWNELLLTQALYDFWMDFFEQLGGNWRPFLAFLPEGVGQLENGWFESRLFDRKRFDPAIAATDRRPDFLEPHVKLGQLVTSRLGVARKLCTLNVFVFGIVFA